MYVSLNDIPASNTTLFNITINNMRGRNILINARDSVQVNATFDSITYGNNRLLRQITNGNYDFDPGNISRFDAASNNVTLRVGLPGGSETVILFA